MTADGWAAGDVVGERELTVDEIDLFLFSAACWLPHRIHYDRRYAQSEGLNDIAIHGPLQASWLSQLAAAWVRAHSGTLHHVTIRHVNLAYPTEQLRCVVTIEAVEQGAAGVNVSLAMRVEKSGGVPSTLGSAIAVIPIRAGA